MLRIYILIFIFLLLIFGQISGGAMGERPDYKLQIKEKFQKINLSDGVSKEEATIIAQNALIENGGDKDCIISSAEVFAEDDSYRDKNYWHISFKTTSRFRSRTGLEWITTNVNKKTGEMVGGGAGPS